MGLERSDTKLRDDVSTAKVCGKCRCLSSLKNNKNFVDPALFRHYVDCVYVMRQMVLGEDDDGRRADRIMRKALSNVSLSTIYRLFRQGDVQIENHSIKPEDRLKRGDILQIFLPEALAAAYDQKSDEGPTAPPPVPPLPQEAPRIIWQNRHLVAFHKPRGMLVHDGQMSLTAHALGLLRDQLSPSVSFSPGPLHRLDRNTSGIVMFSKTLVGAEKFTAAIRNRQVRKFYVAIVQGKISEAALFSDTLSRDTQRRVSSVDKKGRAASLYAFPLLHHDGYSLLLVELHTGITHQIRAQLAAHGMPLAGDTKYGGQATPKIRHYFLHSYCLYLGSPLFGDMPPEIIDPVPEDFSTATTALFDADSEKLDTEIFQGIGRLLEN